jgi:hypothetical protein
MEVSLAATGLGDTDGQVDVSWDLGILDGSGGKNRLPLVVFN